MKCVKRSIYDKQVFGLVSGLLCGGDVDVLLKPRHGVNDNNLSNNGTCKTAQSKRPGRM